MFLHRRSRPLRLRVLMGVVSKILHAPRVDTIVINVLLCRLPPLPCAELTPPLASAAARGQNLALASEIARLKKQVSFMVSASSKTSPSGSGFTSQEADNLLGLADTGGAASSAVSPLADSSAAESAAAPEVSSTASPATSPSAGDPAPLLSPALRDAASGGLQPSARVHASSPAPLRTRSSAKKSAAKPAVSIPPLGCPPWCSAITGSWGFLPYETQSFYCSPEGQQQWTGASLDVVRQHQAEEEERREARLRAEDPLIEEARAAEVATDAAATASAKAALENYAAGGGRSREAGSRASNVLPHGGNGLRASSRS